MKKVLIIGGSGGIGSSCIDIFIRNKWKVFATYFSEKNNKKGRGVIWYRMDISDDLSISSLVNKVNKVDAVIFCSSINKNERFSSFDKDTAHKIFGVNVIDQIFLLKKLRSKLTKKYSVVFFTSITGKIGSSRRISYSISKSAINGLVKTLAIEFAPNGRINAVCPGYIDTPQYHKNSTIPERERVKGVLLKRLGTAREVAKLAFFLASDDSSYITGQTIQIDGGVVGVV